MRKNTLLMDSIIILGISFAIFGISELILRMVFPEKQIKDSNTLESVAYEFNDNYLISLKPNVAKDFVRTEENGGYITRWKTNSNSFRGLELKDNPNHRIIVYGDSNIQAEFSGTALTYPGQLAHYLNKNGMSDVEVLNAGVVGFGPDQSLIRFAKEVDTYKPNLVIFHIFADNDFGDIIRNRLFSLDANGNLMRVDHKKTVDAHLSVSERRKFKTFISQLLTVRALKKAIRSLTKGNSSEELNDANETKGALNNETTFDLFQKLVEAEYLVYKESGPRKFSHFEDHYDIDIALNPEQESSKTKIRLMEEILKEANKMARMKGINFLVLIQPSAIDLTKDNYPLSYEYLQKYPNYKRTNLTNAVEGMCVLHNIKSINLFNVFMENGPEDLFFKGIDGHWTDQGQQLAAKETALYIIHHSMIDSKQH